MGCQSEFWSVNLEGGHTWSVPPVISPWTFLPLESLGDLPERAKQKLRTASEGRINSGNYWTESGVLPTALELPGNIREPTLEEIIDANGETLLIRPTSHLVAWCYLRIPRPHSTLGQGLDCHPASILTGITRLCSIHMILVVPRDYAVRRIND